MSRISDTLYFDVVAETASKVLRRPPLILRNPFTGRVFWVEGMHNCPRELLEAAALDLEATDPRELRDALLH